MATVSFYAFVSNYISASLAPALPAWNKEFPHDRQPTKDLMQLVAVRPWIPPESVMYYELQYADPAA